MEHLQNPSASLSSEVFASDGTLMGKFYIQDRSNVDYKDISKHVIDALISTEDVRFYDHSDLEMVIESSEGEDARFSYLIHRGEESLRIVELIQCKKRESNESSDIHAGAMKGDEWAAGKITLSDLSGWVEIKRPKHSVSDLLAADAHLYFTAIVFGELANKVNELMENETLRNAYAQSAMRRAQQYTTTAMAENYLQVYRQLLQQQKQIIQQEIL